MKLAAYLEGHSPQPIGRSMVVQARREGLHYKEKHVKVTMWWPILSPSPSGR
ncbi:MAG: hypothetical protein LBV77_03285 [Candidatus Adiutrix intracellularis]|jgi:hypothetical protein|nr:hypothetical protein [Candidatus Adiutrix intracellularis]